MKDFGKQKKNVTNGFLRHTVHKHTRARTQTTQHNNTLRHNTHTPNTHTHTHNELKMEIVVVDDYDTLSEKAADWVIAAIGDKADSTVVFPTGRTPLGLYAALVERKKKGLFDPSKLRIFLLDEYVGVQPEDPRSLLSTMQSLLLTPLGIGPEQITSLPGNKPDPHAACLEYHNAVQTAGGLDVVVLGLGPNGHIGYNEPPADASSTTRVLDLTESSLATCARDWGGRDKLLPQAITMGMDLLLAAKKKLLLVSGAGKQDIYKATVQGPQTPDVPASYLQQAAGVTILADKAAAALTLGGGGEGSA